MMRVLLLVSISVLFFTACQNSGSETMLTVNMHNADGDMVGTAALSEQEEGVQFKIKLEGLSPGFHAIHVHENAVCEGPDFESAGNHFNPEGLEHGLLHPEGSHLGDLPNIEADGSGNVDAELMLPKATLTDGKYSLLANEGTTLIVHEGQDDGMSQPGGDSGKRIICGEISRDDEGESSGEATDPTEFNEEEE